MQQDSKKEWQKVKWTRKVHVSVSVRYCGCVANERGQWILTIAIAHCYDPQGTPGAEASPASHLAAYVAYDQPGVPHEQLLSCQALGFISALQAGVVFMYHVPVSVSVSRTLDHFCMCTNNYAQKLERHTSPHIVRARPSAFNVSMNL